MSVFRGKPVKCARGGSSRRQPEEPAGNSPPQYLRTAGRRYPAGQICPMSENHGVGTVLSGTSDMAAAPCRGVLLFRWTGWYMTTQIRRAAAPLLHGGGGVPRRFMKRKPVGAWFPEPVIAYKGRRLWLSLMRLSIPNAGFPGGGAAQRRGI